MYINLSFLFLIISSVCFGIEPNVSVQENSTSSAPETLETRKVEDGLTRYEKLDSPTDKNDSPTDENVKEGSKKNRNAFLLFTGTITALVAYYAWMRRSTAPTQTAPTQPPHHSIHLKPSPHLQAPPRQAPPRQAPSRQTPPPASQSQDDIDQIIHTFEFTATDPSSLYPSALVDSVSTDLNRAVVHFYQASEKNKTPVHGYKHANRCRIWGKVLAHAAKLQGVKWEPRELAMIDILTALHDSGRQGNEGKDLYEEKSAKVIAHFLTHYQTPLALTEEEIEDISASIINMSGTPHIPKTKIARKIFRIENAADSLDIMRLAPLHVSKHKKQPFIKSHFAAVFDGSDRAPQLRDDKFSFGIDSDAILEEIDTFLELTDKLRENYIKDNIKSLKLNFPKDTDPENIHSIFVNYLLKHQKLFPLLTRYFTAET